MGCVTSGAKETSLAQQNQQRQQEQQRQREQHAAIQKKIELEKAFNMRVGKPAPAFIGYEGGNIFPVPQNSWGPFAPASKGGGMMFVGGSGGNGLAGNVTSVRFMDAYKNHDERVTYMKDRQAVHPISGQTLGRNDAARHLNPFGKNEI